MANKIVAKQTAELAAQVEIGKGKLDEFVKAQEAELRNDWGANYEVNLSKAAQAAKIAGFDLNDNELANNAKFIKAMNTVSQLIKRQREAAGIMRRLQGVKE